MGKNGRSYSRDPSGDPVILSRSMRDLDETVRAVAPKDVVVTLIGESGTGKEVLARRIHALSQRGGGPFLPINCAALPESLFESELFGHERGAFTGATERIRGKVEASAGGTLFFDELGELPLALQAKLLRFLENRRFMRVGGSTKVSVDTRVICATLRPLELEVRAGRFRSDLFYRIEGITIEIPPLRERRADIGPLARHFISELSAFHRVAPPRLGAAATRALERHPWPGNIRQLRNAMERLCLLRSGRAVRLGDLPRLPEEPVAKRSNEAVPLVEGPLDHIVDVALRRALAAENGNRSQAARRLGISVRTIQRHLARRPA